MTVESILKGYGELVSYPNSRVGIREDGRSSLAKLFVGGLSAVKVQSVLGIDTTLDRNGWKTVKSMTGFSVHDNGFSVCAVNIFRSRASMRWGWNDITASIDSSSMLLIRRCHSCGYTISDSTAEYAFCVVCEHIEWRCLYCSTIQSGRPHLDKTYCLKQFQQCDCHYTYTTVDDCITCGCGAITVDQATRALATRLRYADQHGRTGLHTVTARPDLAVTR